MTPGAQRPWSVTALCRRLGDWMDDEFNPVRVVGEVSGFVQAASGHCYFTLKDADAQLRCAMFRRAAMALPRLPVNGDKVEVRARLGLHAVRGELQLVVEELQPAGQGNHMEQFLRLKAKLEAQGLFDPARKRTLPTIAACIGLVTSPDAAALADVLTALERRCAHIPVVLSPCIVQGADAPQSIVSALELLYERLGDASAAPTEKPSVILMVRGGGAWEDLHAFNDEAVAHCIANSPVPVVSGIGHETDFTIADFVADVRAATPTAAAELCAAPQVDLIQSLVSLEERIGRAMERALDAGDQQLDWMTSVLSRPAHGVAGMAAGVERLAHALAMAVQPTLSQCCVGVDAWQTRLQVTGDRFVAHRSQKLDQLGIRLDSSNPAQTLARGYAWLQGPSGLVTSASQVHAGDRITATLADGTVDMQVLSG